MQILTTVSVAKSGVFLHNWATFTLLLWVSLRVKVIFTECNFDGMDPRQMGKQWENTVIQLDKVPLKC